jgi:hypothetical protein
MLSLASGRFGGGAAPPGQLFPARRGAPERRPGAAAWRLTPTSVGAPHAPPLALSMAGPGRSGMRLDRRMRQRMGG